MSETLRDLWLENQAAMWLGSLKPMRRCLEAIPERQDLHLTEKYP